MHKLSIIFFKLRTYGIKGAIDAVLRYFRRDTPLHQMMFRMAAHTKSVPQRGITIIGDMSTHASLPKVLCDLYQKLQECDIPCQCLDLMQPFDDRFPILKYDHIIVMHYNQLPRKFRKLVKIAVIVFWEFDSGLLEGYPHLIDESPIAMSDFNYRYFTNVFPPKTVKKILYPFQLESAPLAKFNPEIRQKLKIPAKAFVVFFNFELGTKRKNPEGLLSAFAQAFPDQLDTVLLFKTMSAKLFPECITALEKQAESLGLKNRFITINTYIPTQDLMGLTETCDVYCSLHRGEGFGLGIAEAMLQAKPVIVTDWSAPGEFCDDTNSIRIPYKFRPIQPSSRQLPYDGVIQWAEPDIEASAAALRKLYEDPALRKRLGENGRKTILEHFSHDNFKKSITDFLDS